MATQEPRMMTIRPTTSPMKPMRRRLSALQVVEGNGLTALAAAYPRGFSWCEQNWHM
jgi:hypothetical protein